MKRIIVIGCPGSGKSTFSKQRHQLTGLPLFHLDLLNWNADRTVVEKHVFRKRLEDTVRQDAWIIDGNYGSTIELRLQACDIEFIRNYNTVSRPKVMDLFINMRTKKLLYLKAEGKQSSI